LSPGVYNFRIDARNLGAVTDFEAYKVFNFIIADPVTSVTATPNTPSPKSAGVQITFEALASGNSGYYEYRYQMHDGVKWNVVKPYSTNRYYPWDTTGLPPGVYNFRIDARNLGAVTDFEAYKVFNFIIADPVTGVTATPNTPSPKSAGVQVTFEGLATGNSGYYEYRYQMHDGVRWNIVKSYSTNRYYPWDTTGLSPGVYNFRIDARNLGAVTDFEAYKVFNFIIADPVTGVTATPNTPSPKSAGVQVTFEGLATGNSGYYEYRYQMHDGVKWNVVKPYSTNRYYPWDTTGLSPGVYNFRIDARNLGSVTDVEAYKVFNFIIADPVTSVTATPNTPSPKSAGVQVTFEGLAMGNSGYYEYRYQIHDGVKWNVVKSYSTNRYYSWDTTDLPPGVYNFRIDARNLGSVTDFEAYKVFSFTIN